MIDTRRNGYSQASVLLGWLIAALYAVHGAVAIFMPRAEKTSAIRETLRGWHYLMGLALFVLLAWRLLCWYREKRPAAPAGLRAAGHLWTRLLAVSVYVVMVLMPPLGLAQAWTDGLTVHIGPFFALPALVPVNRTGWMFSGYFHSALSFAVFLLTLVAVLTGVYQWLRRGVGLLRAFPPGFGVQLWISLLTAAYAFSTFREEQGLGARVIASYVVATVVIWAAGILLARGRAAPVQVITAARPAAAARVAAVMAVLAILGYAAYAPHAMFRVNPWPIGEVVTAAPEEMSHPRPVVKVAVVPETPLERQVRADVFKWCRFCHTMEKGARPLAGPNLYAIFGQRAGTVPNFYYSKAMAEAGRRGLVWDDATLDGFLANPDAYVPGTSMVISIGPVKTAAERAAVINILKKETMPAESRE